MNKKVMDAGKQLQITQPIWQVKTLCKYLQTVDSQSIIFKGKFPNDAEQFARNFAAAKFCMQPEPDTALACNVCIECNKFKVYSQLDYLEVETDENQIKVDAVRNMFKFLSTIERGKQKIIHLVSAEKLNISSSNALLKILEEPHNNVIFLLSTRFPNQLPTTVLSRCLQLPTSIVEHTEQNTENSLHELKQMLVVEGVVKHDPAFLQIALGLARGESAMAYSLFELVPSFNILLDAVCSFVRGEGDLALLANRLKKDQIENNTVITWILQLLVASMIPNEINYRYRDLLPQIAKFKTAISEHKTSSELEQNLCESWDKANMYLKSLSENAALSLDLMLTDTLSPLT